MIHQLSFDTATDDVTDVLDTVARIYGVTLDEAAGNGFTEETAGPERAADTADDRPTPLRLVTFAPFQQWTYNRTVNFLRGLTPRAYAMCALLAARGRVTSAEAMAFLDVDTLRGYLSSIGYTLRATYGLKHAVVYASVTTNEGTVFTMEEPLRELFAAAMRELDFAPYEDAKTAA